MDSPLASHRIYPNVHLGAQAEVGDFVILGMPPRGKEPGALETRIGDQAVIRSHTIIYAGNTVGQRFQTGHAVMIRELNTIGDDVSVGTHTIIEHHVQIAHRVRVHSNAFIPEYSILEEGAWVGPGVVFTNAQYPLSPDAKANLKGPRLLAGAKVGAHATLLPGVVIGRHALVGAGSVVVRDVADYQVVVGNPARVIKDVRQLSAYDFEQLTRST